MPQYTFDWCVAPSIQMMHNLIDDTGAGTWTDRVQQGELWELARALSFNSFNGANPLGWAEVLTEVGMGPDAVVSVADYEEALQTATRTIADTDRVCRPATCWCCRSPRPYQPLIALIP
ncbi:UNVERIFIED_ORG: formate-dependent nitrite reductase cytochrome c552 subunit [Arthrobacter sp. UYEF10]